MPRFVLPVLFVAALGGCASLPPGADRAKPVSVADDHPEATRAGRIVAAQALQHPELSGFHLLQAGVDGFLTRAQMADAAERTLDVQYFILRGDESGRLLTDALLRAADRGVRVRILVDDGETVEGDEQILLLGAHPHVEVRVFNPFRYRGHSKLVRAVEWSLNANRLDYRMHNKLFVADNAVALMGGRNIGDEYFQVDPDGQFADDDLFTAGPIVRELSGKFDDFWNSDLAIPVTALSGSRPTPEALAAYRQTLVGKRDESLPDGRDYAARIASRQPYEGMLGGAIALTWASWTVVCDSPDKKQVERGWRVGELMARPVADTAAAVQSELLMVTPYLVPGEEGMRLLQGLRERGVAVRILTNSLESSTVPAAQAGYLHYRVSLVEDGVGLHEVRSLLGSTRGSGEAAAIARYGNYSLHGKMMVFDRRRIFVGSMNFDQRSMHLNTEIGVIIESEDLAQQIATRFAAMVAPENAYRVVLDDAAPRGRPRLHWQTVEQGRPVDYATEPAKTAWQRLQVDVIGLLPIDSEL